MCATHIAINIAHLALLGDVAFDFSHPGRVQITTSDGVEMRDVLNKNDRSNSHMLYSTRFCALHPEAPPEWIQHDNHPSVHRFMEAHGQAFRDVLDHAIHRSEDVDHCLLGLQQLYEDEGERLAEADMKSHANKNWNIQLRHTTNMLGMGLPPSSPRLINLVRCIIETGRAHMPVEYPFELLVLTFLKHARKSWMWHAIGSSDLWLAYEVKMGKVVSVGQHVARHGMPTIPALREAVMPIMERSKSAHRFAQRLSACETNEDRKHVLNQLLREQWCIDDGTLKEHMHLLEVADDEILPVMCHLCLKCNIKVQELGADDVIVQLTRVSGQTLLSKREFDMCSRTLGDGALSFIRTSISALYENLQGDGGKCSAAMPEEAPSPKGLGIVAQLLWVDRYPEVMEEYPLVVHVLNTPNSLIGQDVGVADANLLWMEGHHTVASVIALLSEAKGNDVSGLAWSPLRWLQEHPTPLIENFTRRFTDPSPLCPPSPACLEAMTCGEHVTLHSTYLQAAMPTLDAVGILASYAKTLPFPIGLVEHFASQGGTLAHIIRDGRIPDGLDAEHVERIVMFLAAHGADAFRRQWGVTTGFTALHHATQELCTNEAIIHATRQSIFNKGDDEWLRIHVTAYLRTRDELSDDTRIRLIANFQEATAWRKCIEWGIPPEDIAQECIVCLDTLPGVLNRCGVCSACLMCEGCWEGVGRKCPSCRTQN